MIFVFKESPQLFTHIHCVFTKFGAILIASANAWHGSREGEIFSNLDTS